MGIKQVVTKVGTGAEVKADELAGYIAAATGYEQNKTEFENVFNGELVKAGRYDRRDKWVKIGNDGDSKTVLKVEKVDAKSAYNEEAAIRVATREIAKGLDELHSTTFAAKDNKDNIVPTENGDKYADYTYTGTVSDIVTVKDVSGSVAYYVAYTVTQNTAVKTFTV